MRSASDRRETGEKEERIAETIMGRKSNSGAALPAASHSGVAAGYEDFFSAAMSTWSICAYCSSDDSYDLA